MDPHREENGKMKKLIALLLALMLALALAVPASAAGEDIGIIGGADGPTYILVSADPKAAATVSKEQREQNIKALGGVAGQVNVLLGDRCIAFTGRGARGEERAHDGAAARRAGGHGRKDRI